MNSFLLAVVVILVFVGGFYIYIDTINSNIRKERTRLDAIDAAKWAEMNKLRSPEYILMHNPSFWQVRNILDSNPDSNIKSLAIQVALRSQDIATLSLVEKYAPAYADQAMTAYLEVVFSQATTAEECEKLIKDHSYHSSEWWLTWKSRLEQKAQKARQSERKVAFLQQAKAAGLEVCPDCNTIDPLKCDYCDCCISGKRGCSHSFGGLCSTCAVDSNE